MRTRSTQRAGVDHGYVVANTVGSNNVERNGGNIPPGDRVNLRTGRGLLHLTTCSTRIPRKSGDSFMTAPRTRAPLALMTHPCAPAVFPGIPKGQPQTFPIA